MDIKISVSQTEPIKERNVDNPFISFPVGGISRFGKTFDDGRLYWKSYNLEFRDDMHTNPNIRNHVLRTVWPAVFWQKSRAEIKDMIARFVGTEAEWFFAQERGTNNLWLVLRAGTHMDHIPSAIVYAHGVKFGRDFQPENVLTHFNEAYGIVEIWLTWNEKPFLADSGWYRVVTGGSEHKWFALRWWWQSKSKWQESIREYSLEALYTHAEATGVFIRHLPVLQDEGSQP